jgi:hypothetical protein
MVEGVHVVAPDGTILFSNAANDAMFGYPAGGLIGKEVTTLTDLPAHESHALSETIASEVARRGHWRGEISNRRRDGTQFVTRVRISAIQLHGQSCRLSVREDVTETKRLEAQLLRAQRLESVGRLASGIAHDLNNILAPIMMMAPMLQTEISEQETKKLLRILEISVDRGAHLVRQLLYFGRGIEGRRGPLRLKDSVREIVQLIGETFPRTIAIKAHVASDTHVISADTTQVHQLLLNLCVNARDAMPNGGTLRIEVENILSATDRDTAPGLSPGAYVRITISDTGTGIPAEHIGKIWDPFFTTKEPGKGTGLGLSTVLGIVKAHGGSVDVQTEPGRGTQFFIYLPAEPTGIAPANRATASLAPIGHGETILVVEDETAIRQLIETILQNHGYNVVTATNGEEGAAEFKKHVERVSLVLTDFDMPVMNGLSLVRAIRDIAPVTKVIVASGIRSGLDSGNFLAEFQRLGIRTLLTKPFTPEVLLRTIHGMLHSSPYLAAGRE